MAKNYADIDGKSKKPKRNLAGFGKAADPADPAGLFEAEYVDVLVFAMQEGLALRIGLTRDLGAICVGVYDGGQVQNNYMRSVEEIAEFFQKLYTYAKGSDEV